MCIDKDIKIAIVCPWFYKGDAVGQNAYDHYRAFRSLGFRNVRGIGTRNDYQDMPFEFAGGREALEKNAWFKQANIIIYHFAIYHEYFDVIASRKKNGKHVVCFHNVTPKHLMPVHTWEVIDKSFAQIQAFNFADAIWADSRENLEELQRQGILQTPIFELPLPVEHPIKMTRFSEKECRRIEILCVGRFFSSKGVLDVVRAMKSVQRCAQFPTILRLVGNTDFSDYNYIQEIKTTIRQLGLGEYVDFVGKVDGPTLDRLFSQAHIYVSASYHEGFCVPVIEALRAGAIPVTYDAGNLKWIAGQCGIQVPTGNVEAFGVALANLVSVIKYSIREPDVNLFKMGVENQSSTSDLSFVSANSFSEMACKHALTYSFDSFKSNILLALSNVYRGAVSNV